LVFPARAGAVISQLDSVVVAVSPLLASLLRARVSDAGGLIFFRSKLIVVSSICHLQRNFIFFNTSEAI
jgi:hypothetical protein